MLFIVNIIALGSINNDSTETEKPKEETEKPKEKTEKHKKKSMPKNKKDIDKMSDEDLDSYTIFNDNDKGSKLYKKDKELYKYLFAKSFDKNYDSVITPNEQTIQNLKDDKNLDLTTEETVKLELENPALYSKYLDIYSSKLYSEDDEDTIEPEDDEDKLKESIKSQLSTSTLKSLNYNNDSLGKNAVVVLKGKENITDKLTSQSMRDDVANAVKGAKESNVDLDDITIDVTYPVEDDKGNRNNDFHVIKSYWSMEIINNMSEEQLELLNTDLDKFAVSYDESSALR